MVQRYSAIAGRVEVRNTQSQAPASAVLRWADIPARISWWEIGVLKFASQIRHSPMAVPQRTGLRMKARNPGEKK
jgi:hypothetical protein